MRSDGCREGLGDRLEIRGGGGVTAAAGGVGIAGMSHPGPPRESASLTLLTVVEAAARLGCRLSGCSDGFGTGYRPDARSRGVAGAGRGGGGAGPQRTPARPLPPSRPALPGPTSSETGVPNGNPSGHSPGRPSLIRSGHPERGRGDGADHSPHSPGLLPMDGSPRCVGMNP